MGNQALQRRYIQTGLIVSQPGDRHEHQANQAAEQVMRKPADNLSPPALRQFNGRQQSKCSECEHEQPVLPATVQRKRSDAAAGTAQAKTAPAVAAAIQGGQPLGRTARAFFEPRFGQDFSDVRIHADSSGNLAARQLQANAFTTGHHIVFARHQYAPETLAGRYLLAHELAHVIQQRSQPGELKIQRMAACPESLQESDPVPNGWKDYFGWNSIFHCGCRVILEDRNPTAGDPQNECAYDETGALVDRNHAYAGCRGTPNSYDSSSSSWDHFWNDPGGIWHAGWDAFWTSRTHDHKPQGECAARCMEGPEWSWGTCIKDCR